MAFYLSRVYKLVKNLRAEGFNEKPALAMSKYLGKFENFVSRDDPLKVVILPFDVKSFYFYKLSRVNLIEISERAAKYLEQGLDQLNVAF